MQTMKNSLFVILTINQLFLELLQCCEWSEFPNLKMFEFSKKLESNNVYNNMCDFVVTYNFVCN